MPAPESHTPGALPRGSRLKSSVAAALATPLTGRVIGAVWRDRVPSAMGRIDTSDPSIPPVVKARLALRLYERAELRFVAEHLRRDLPVVELGASIGVITRAIAARVGPDVPILAVEANPRLIAPLRRNLELASGTEQVRVVHAAVTSHGSPDGTVRLGFGPASTDGRLTPTASAGGDVAVPATSLGALLAAEGIDGAYTLVCDIEGAEADLLTDEAEAFGRCCQAIIETHDTSVAGTPISWPDLIDAFAALPGMRVIARHGPVIVLERAPTP